MSTAQLDKSDRFCFVSMRRLARNIASPRVCTESTYRSDLIYLQYSTLNSFFHRKMKKDIESISCYCSIGTRQCDLHYTSLPCSLFPSQNLTLVQNPSVVTHNTAASKHPMVLHVCVCHLYAHWSTVLCVVRMETLIPTSVH